MNDDERRTTEHITRVARETYNAPPATPRDEMWLEIEARLEGSVSRGDAKDVLPLARGPREAGRGSRALPWWLGIAAALVIGLGIGRLSSDGGIPAGAERDAPAVAEAPASVPVGTPSGSDSTVLDEEQNAEPGESQPSRDQTIVREDTPRPESVNRERARNVEGNPTPVDRAATPDAPGAGGTMLPYVVATRQHLGRSESFLTSVRAELDEGDADSQLGPWARSLLVRTRLLLGSPAASDAETRRLLEDLELMLAQIAIAAEGRDPGEARIFDRGLEEGDLMYRLRSATDGNIGTNARGLRASSL